MTTGLVTPRSLKTSAHPALEPLRQAGFEIRIPAPGAMPDAAALKAALPGCAGWLAGVEKITGEIMAAGDALKIISRNGVAIEGADVEVQALLLELGRIMLREQVVVARLVELGAVE